MLLSDSASSCVTETSSIIRPYVQNVFKDLIILSLKIASEHDQEIPQSQTEDKPVAS